jgi:pyridoxamine 5'-phosphate oxidase
VSVADAFDASGDPIARFLAAWEVVQSTAPAGVDPAAMTLATTSAALEPSARIVLLRDVTARGFRFFTNYGSRKARELDSTGRAALCFHWFWLEEQVRVEGTVSRATAEESDAYFASRPRGSQLGAWASRQGEPLDSRSTLEARYREIEHRYDGQPVPRPPFWGGFTLIPDVIEFWRAGEYRLHDRVQYRRQGEAWTVRRLYP